MIQQTSFQQEAIPVMPLQEPRLYTLPNGSPLHFLPTEDSGLVKVMIVYDNPGVFAPQHTLAECTFQLLKSGTRRLGTVPFVTSIEETGMLLSNGITADAGTIEFVVLKEQLPAALMLIFEMITTPALPEEEFVRIKTIALENWRISRKQTHVIAREEFMKALFAGHPYGVIAGEEDIQSIQYEDVKAFHNDHILPVQPRLFVASDNAASVISAFSDAMKSYPVGIKESGMAGYPSNRSNGEAVARLIRIPLEDRVQSSIRLGRKLFLRSHPDYVKGKVTATILGGYFSSRLMANLREDKGYTYGVGAGLVSMALNGYFTISADVGNAHLEHALSEIMKEISRMRFEPVEEEELLTVKQYLLGTTLRELDGVFSQLSLIATLQRQGLSVSWMNDYIRALDALDAADVMQFASEYLQEESLLCVTCGNTEQ